MTFCSIATIRKPGPPSWPYIDYDLPKNSEEVIPALRRQLREIQFAASTLHTTHKAEERIAQEHGQYDG